MGSPAVTPSSRTSLLVVAVALSAFLFLGASEDATAGCTDYSDYLHWISTLELADDTGSLAIQGNYQYIVENYQGDAHLTIADITNESSPSIVSRTALPFNATTISARGSTVAIADASVTGPGVYLLDVSDPELPEIVGSCYEDAYCSRPIIADTLLYVLHHNLTTMEFSLGVFDISDPTSPAVRDSMELPSQPTGSLILHGDYLYLSASSIVTIDVSDPDAPFVADTDAIEFWDIRDIAIDGDHIYAGARRPNWDIEIRAYSLSGHPGNPAPDGSFQIPLQGSSVWPVIEAAAGNCYIGYDTHYLYRVDVSSPPAYEVHIFPRGGALRELAVIGSNLYTTVVNGDHGYVHAYSVSSPSPLEPISSVDTPGDALDVAVAPGRATLAYVADGTAGVQIVDITNPLAPVIIDVIDTPGEATEIELVDTLAYVADGSAGLQVLNVATPGIIGAVDTPGTAVDLAVDGDFVYMADSSAGLRVIDVAIPAAPFLRAAVDTYNMEPIDVTGVDVEGGVAYAAAGTHGLLLCNVEEPDDPWVIDGVKSRELSGANRVDVVLDRAYVTDGVDGLVVVDVSTPTSPAVRSDIATDGAPGDVNMLGLFAFVGSGAGMRLIDVQDDTNPVMVGGVDVPETARGIYANADYAYIAAGSAGLQVCPTQCGFDEAILAAFSATPQADFYPITVEFTNECLGYGMSYDWDFGDGVGTSTARHPTYSYTEPGDYTVTLEVTNGTNTEVVSLVVSALAEPPTVTSVTDVPEDQGGHVYVDFYHSGYDDTQPSRAELYTVQRQDDGNWVGLTTLGAYGEHYYTALVPTQGDGVEWDTPFRVIAHMDEGIWIGDPVSGFSLDNIAPQVPQNLDWPTWGYLAWSAVPDEDFAYYQVYGSPTEDFVDAEPVTATIETGVVVNPAAYARFFVAAVDDAGLESDPAIAPEETGVDEIVTEVALSQAHPNPFNPTTAIGYALPADGRVSLRVYDVSGRVVRTLVDHEMPAGRHAAVWSGRDDAGNEAASGVYFYQLDAGGKTLRRSMTLLK